MAATSVKFQGNVWNCRPEEDEEEEFNIREDAATVELMAGEQLPALGFIYSSVVCSCPASSQILHPIHSNLAPPSVCIEPSTALTGQWVDVHIEPKAWMH